MNKAVLLLGSNLGDGQLLFQQVISLIHERIGKLEMQSTLYQSPPWGFEHENNFLNQVLILETDLAAGEILQTCLQIEVDLGRKRTTQRYGARTIDIDVLFVNDEVMQTESLVLPHPRLHLRKFTLLPLLELIPDYVHPTLQKSIQDLLIACEDNSEVRKI
tara:strand:- start:1499 stop:1981 length:483 start_codon:yes stop_codon:yes gene_type:complete